MSFYIDDTPIIACSTGNISNTAIAVIRLSGFKNYLDLKHFFSLDFSQLKPRYAHLTNLIDGDLIIDNVILTFFPENSSYNGENIFEISVHGNQLNISRIISIFVNSKKFRLASAGEFSYRALKNGKLSLTQVEGLDMLLNANSNLMLDQGLQVLQGELHQKYLALYDSFLKLKAAVEISIDFSEDVGDLQSKELLNSNLLEFKNILTSLYARTRSSVSSLTSPDVVICGETNAGKSSLFNLLLNHNRSIVSAIPGTTRDYVSELITVNGTNFRLLDTAGIRDADDIIENEGIDRAFEILKTSFYKILVINPFLFNLNYLKRFSEIEFDLVIFSHADLPDFIKTINYSNFTFLNINKYLTASFKTGSIGPIVKFTTKNSSGPIEPLNLTGPIEPAIKTLFINKFNMLAAENPILLDRHRNSIAKVYTKFIEIEEIISNINDIAIISQEINILSSYLSELIGIFSPDDVLNSIFSNFCIGK